MSLEDAVTHLKAAEQALTPLVEREQQQKQGKPIEYLVAYEQKYRDTEEWGPNYQLIDAYDMEQMFCSFGHFVFTMGLTVRNICYGPWNEMTYVYEQVHDYWQAQQRKEKE